MALMEACELLVDVEDLGCDCDLPEDEFLIERVLEAASDFLSILAGTRLGRCTDLYRPCRDVHCTTSLCACCKLNGIHLPGLMPTVTEILIDGAVVDPATYTVVINPASKFVLVRFNADGNTIYWPRCQKVYLPSTAEDTFEIAVESGYARNQLMTLAAAEIACDIFAFMAGQDHMLPQGVVAAAAYGMQMDFRRFSDPTNQATMDLAGLVWTSRFLQSIPESRGTEILSPELDDGWSLFALA